MRALGRIAVAALAVSLPAASVVACGTGGSAGGSGDRPGSAVASSLESPVTPVPRPDSPPATDAAEPPAMPEVASEPPPSVAGPLGPGNLPGPAALGPGWRTYADPGGAEVGFEGNGAWTRRREPHQAAFEALPLGCTKRLPDGSLPVPAHALQGSYRNGSGAPATVLVLRFRTAREASAYFAGYTARMAACGSTPGAAFQSLAVTRLWAARDALASVRAYTGAESFVEVAVRRGTSVALLASSKAAATADSSDRAWTRTVAPRLAAPLT